MILRPQVRVLAGLAVLVALGVGAVGVVFGAPPAGAHAGGRAQLYLADFRVEPAGSDGWTVQALISDRDSGRPLPGFAVTVTGTSSSGSVFGPVALADPRARGRYGATITLPAGRWALRVDARGFPGGAETRNNVPGTRRCRAAATRRRARKRARRGSCGCRRRRQPR